MSGPKKKVAVGRSAASEPDREELVIGIPAPSHPHLIALLIIVITSLVAFSNSLENDFVRDDLLVILENPMVHSWKELPNLLVSDYWASEVRLTDKLYRPLPMVSYLVNYAISGPDPLGYHLVNLALHVLVTFGVYQLAIRLRLRWEAAVLTAMLFAVHPIHTEVVNPVTGRADLLSTLGVVVALNWYIDLYRKRSFHLRTALASLGAFGMALLCKESAIVLPGLLVLYELTVWDRGCSWRRFAREKGLVLFGYLLVVVVYLGVRWAVLGVMYRSSGHIAFLDNPIAAAAWDVRVLNALVVAGEYVWLCVWPRYLSHDYSYNAIPLATSLWDPRVLGSLGVWLGLCTLAVRSYARGSRVAFFAVGYFFITYLPVSNVLVPIGVFMAERLLYMPSVGLCLLIGAAWHWLVEKSQLQFSRMTAKGWYLLAIMVVVLLSARTVVRNRDWGSHIIMWEAAAQVVPNSAKVQYVLAAIAVSKGRFAEAREHFERVRELYPKYFERDVEVAKRYGAVLLRLKKAAEALPYLQIAVRGWPHWADAQLNLGVAYAMQESWKNAEAAFRKAIALDINKLKAHKGLMVSLRKQGRYQEAIAAADEALAVKSDFITARQNRAAALMALGRREEAQKEFLIIGDLQGHQAPVDPR